MKTSRRRFCVLGSSPTWVAVVRCRRWSWRHLQLLPCHHRGLPAGRTTECRRPLAHGHHTTTSSTSTTSSISTTSMKHALQPGSGLSLLTPCRQHRTGGRRCRRSHLVGPRWRAAARCRGAAAAALVLPLAHSAVIVRRVTSNANHTAGGGLCHRNTRSGRTLDAMAAAAAIVTPCLATATSVLRLPVLLGVVTVAEGADDTTTVTARQPHNARRCRHSRRWCRNLPCITAHGRQMPAAAPPGRHLVPLQSDPAAAPQASVALRPYGAVFPRITSAAHPASH